MTSNYNPPPYKQYRNWSRICQEAMKAAHNVCEACGLEPGEFPAILGVSFLYEDPNDNEHQLLYLCLLDKHLWLSLSPKAANRGDALFQIRERRYRRGFIPAVIPSGVKCVSCGQDTGLEHPDFVADCKGKWKRLAIDDRR